MGKGIIMLSLSLIKYRWLFKPDQEVSELKHFLGYSWYTVMKANWTLLDKLEKEQEKELALLREIKRTETEEEVTGKWKEVTHGQKITVVEVAEEWKEKIKEKEEGEEVQKGQEVGGVKEIKEDWLRKRWKMDSGV